MTIFSYFKQKKTSDAYVYRFNCKHQKISGVTLAGGEKHRFSTEKLSQWGDGCLSTSRTKTASFMGQAICSLLMLNEFWLPSSQWGDGINT